jgi:hypothetical protein
VSLAKRWKLGGVEYPLTDETENSLLEDADPALYHAIRFFTNVLNTYVKPRLLAQAALDGLHFPSAVEKTLHFEPTPFLLSDQLVFPLFCLYRSEEVWSGQNAAFDHCDSVWEWAYVLPPMTPRQVEQIHPILRTVSAVIANFAMESYDPGFENGTPLRDLGGIQKMTAGPARWGSFERVSELDRWWRALTGRILVSEKLDIVPGEFLPFDGVNNDIDLAAKGEASVEAFVEVDTKPAPIVESVGPSSGTKAGGVSLSITGKHFRVGTTPRVLVGGAYASSVNVVHATNITCLTPEHAAYPTFAADVQVIDADGQESNVLAGAYTFITP